MNLVRRLGFGLTVSIFAAIVGILILAGTAQQTILQPQTVKRWLSSSGLYTGIIEQAKKAMMPELEKQLASNKLVTPTAVQQSLEATFTPKYLQQKAEQGIDQAYDWLGQKTPQLALHVSLADSRAVFVNNLTAEITAKLATLPACPANKQQVVDDAINGRCMPRGTTPSALANGLVNNAADGISILKFETPQPQQGSQDNPLQHLPQANRFIQLSPFVLWPLLIASAAGIIFLAPTKRYGLSRIGWRLIFGSAFTVIMGLALVVYAPQLSLGQMGMWQLGNENQAAASIDFITPLARVAAADIGKYLLIYSSIALGLGVAILVALLIWRPKRAVAQQQPAKPETQEPSQPQAE